MRLTYFQFSSVLSIYQVIRIGRSLSSAARSPQCLTLAAFRTETHVFRTRRRRAQPHRHVSHLRHGVRAASVRDEQPSETIRPATLSNMREHAKPVRANELPRILRVCS